MGTNNKTFNKKLFSELTLKIKGSRTLVKFSQATTISIAHLSRIINEKLDSPPSPETLKKLLTNPEGKVSYEDLMIAAGYINEEPSNVENLEGYNPCPKFDDSMNIDYNNLKASFNEEHWKKYKSTCMSTILFNLGCSSYSWHIINGRDITCANINEFSLSLTDTPISNWTFQLKYTNYSFKNKGDLTLYIKETVINTWGQLAQTTFQENSKISIVTDLEELYTAFIASPPKNLNLTVSILLVNPEELQILKESYVAYNLKDNLDILEEFLLAEDN